MHCYVMQRLRNEQQEKTLNNESLDNGNQFKLVEVSMDRKIAIFFFF
jgi:hypothetical protein